MIASFQRRDELDRLLSSISAALDPPAAAAIDVMVVLDGSTDGSRELVATRRETFPVELEAIWKENGGLATARNAGIEQARRAFVWLLDDDMEIDRAALERHLGHDRQQAQLLMGPCTVASDDPDLRHATAFYAPRHEQLAVTRAVARPQDCSFANTSAPTDLLRRYPFDEHFRGYGIEDYELAARLLGDQVAIAFDPDAAVIHYFAPTRSERLSKLREEGGNRIRFVRTHPELSDVVFEPTAGRLDRMLRRVARHRVGSMLWRSALLLDRSAAHLGGLRNRMQGYADAFAVYSGVAGMPDAGAILRRRRDPSWLRRGPSSISRWSRARRESTPSQ